MSGKHKMPHVKKDRLNSQEELKEQLLVVFYEYLKKKSAENGKPIDVFGKIDVNISLCYIEIDNMVKNDFNSFQNCNGNNINIGDHFKCKNFNGRTGKKENGSKKSDLKLQLIFFLLVLLFLAGNIMIPYVGDQIKDPMFYILVIVGLFTIITIIKTFRNTMACITTIVTYIIILCISFGFANPKTMLGTIVNTAITYFSK